VFEVDLQSRSRQQIVGAAMHLEEVFVTEGVPKFTFVKPPNYNDIFLDVRRKGKPVIIEGQSGTGKTTCIKSILAELGEELQATYLTARRPGDMAKIGDILADIKNGVYIIDDFHRLPVEIQTALADLAKLAAETGDEADLPKLVIIGINEIGSALIRLVPDIAKRTGIHRIRPGAKEDIDKLIAEGCDRLNITIENAQSIYPETRGDYWLTQQLCQSICTAAGVTETVGNKKSISFETGDIRQRVIDRLHHTYYPAVREFCRGQRFRPSNDPYYRLLRVVGEQGTSIVDLNGLANTNEDVRGSINNIKERRLTALIAAKPLVARHFYYNNETKSFAIEDPALFYYVKHLDWAALRADCGFREGGKVYPFEIAISFAGENRELARLIAGSLEELDVPVFFDEMFEVNFLGKTWARQFKEIFGEKSQFVVCLLDQHHLEKIWPTFEREHFIPRIADESVIPIFLDDTKFPGIPQDLIGIKFRYDPEDPKWKNKVTDEIVMKLIDKVG
jgi:hypothetical protein